MKKHKNDRPYDTLKRLLDIAAALFGLVVVAPILIVAAILIKLDGGPVLFVQDRIGKYGRPFRMLKLRTMVPDAHEMESELREEQFSDGKIFGSESASDPRITRIGALLRLLNIDELPQFWNVLIGDMSMVGPRPVPYLESLIYGRYRPTVLSVRPGLTGYWQVRRRLNTDYMQRVLLDCYYVRNRGLWFDAYIMLITPISMLTSDYNSNTKVLPPDLDQILISEQALRLAPKPGVQAPEPVGAAHSRRLSEPRPDKWAKGSTN